MKWVVLLAIALAVWLALWIIFPANSARPCTHGLSSIGPATISDGKLVAGSTTPRTEACLP